MGQGSIDRPHMCVSVPPTDLCRPNPVGTLGGRGIQRDKRLDHPAASHHVLVR